MVADKETLMCGKRRCDQLARYVNMVAQPGSDGADDSSRWDDLDRWDGWFGEGGDFLNALDTGNLDFGDDEEEEED